MKNRIREGEGVMSHCGTSFRVVLSALLCLCVAVAASAQEALWLELTEKAFNLSEQGKKSEAEKTAQEALKVAEATFGSDHPNTAAAAENLGTVYQVQGNYTKAEPLCRRALEIQEKALGKNSPVVIAMIHKLLGICKKAGKEKEAGEPKKRLKKGP
ncbi:tetratricopeptide repeat protein [Thermodesulfobacteriota bacterium]